MEEKPNGKRETENMEKREEGSWPEGPGRDEDSANREKGVLVEGKECLFLYSAEEEGISGGSPRLPREGQAGETCASSRTCVLNLQACNYTCTK